MDGHHYVILTSKQRSLFVNKQIKYLLEVRSVKVNISLVAEKYYWHNLVAAS